MEPQQANQPKAPAKIPAQKRRLYKKLAAEMMSNGFNATEAYATIKPQIQRTTAASSMSRLLRNDNARAVILEEFARAGVNEANLSDKIAEMLSADGSSKLGAWRQDRAIQHARAIMGLDAEKRIHQTIDKRSLVLTASITASQLGELLASSKPKSIPSNDSLSTSSPLAPIKGDTP